MNALETVRKWIKTFPQHDILSAFRVDYIDQIPANGALFPSGMTEVSRTPDVTGKVLVTNQYNFGIYYVFERAPGDDEGSLMNADWVMDFQEWVQEQSATGKGPKFGNKTTAIKAQNGSLYAADGEGTATYMVQLSITFEKEYEVN